MEKTNNKLSVKRKKPVSWKRLYKFKNKNLWESEPHAFSIYASDIVKSGKVLDIGCGEGYDAIYFLKKNFDVTCFDISEDEIRNIKKAAKENKKKISASVADINKYKLKSKYDIVVSYGVLQFIGKNHNSYFESLKKNTKTGGVHSMYIFGEKGDFKAIAKHKFWFPTKNELKEIYSGWKIIKVKEKKVKLLIKGDKGQHLFNNMYKILVQKIN
jgi:cyclopropane fatty-acyl-phospholipid synthase-like methyltransferase